MAENGTNIRFKLNGTVIAGKLTSGFKSTKDEIELSDADDGDDSVYTLGRGHRELTSEMNLETTGDWDVGDLWTAHDDGTVIPFIYGGTDSGDFVLTGSCAIRDFEMSDPDNGRCTVSIAARVTGAVTKSTYS